MAISVVMPALEMAQETGKLVSWLKKEGEAVVKGQPLLEIETDKAVMEIEATGNGFLAGIRAQEGDVIPVGQTIAWIVESAGEAPPLEDLPAKVAPSAMAEAARHFGEPVSAPASADSSSNARISPKARRLAKEKGIDLSSLRGSGADGEILTSDVLAAAGIAGSAPAIASAGAATLQAQSSIARLMAERTTQSWTSVPHFFVVREVDASALLLAKSQLAPQIAQRHDVKVTVTDLLIALVAAALATHPKMNASWTAEGIRINSEVNVAIAMAVEDAVVAAVIPHADTTKLGDIAVQRRDLTDRARAGKLRPADIAGGTFTISNLGMYNVDSFSAIITPPQAGILAVARIVDRVVPVDGEPGIRPMLTLTLSSDHRVVDGARAAEFLNGLAESILHPQTHLRV